MTPFIFDLLRRADRALLLVLPSRLHGRLRQAAIAVLFRSTPTRQQPRTPAGLRSPPPPDQDSSAVEAIAFTEADDSTPPKPLEKAKKVDRDAIGEIIGPFIAADGGEEIDVSEASPARLKVLPEPAEIALCCAFTGRHELVAQIVEETLNILRESTVPSRDFALPTVRWAGNGKPVLRRRQLTTALRYSVSPVATILSRPV
jgi:hypothetical protein